MHLLSGPKERIPSKFLPVNVACALDQDGNVLQPARSATSRSRWELDEFGAPTTIIASTFGATALTASWRLVVA